jgi:hypothetical protein
LCYIIHHLQVFFYIHRKLVGDYNNLTVRAGVLARKSNRLKRRLFHAAGVNHLWAMDQHDKWQRFGLRLHLCVEPFVGKLMWLVIWWNNTNPRYVAQQFLNTAQKHGGKCSANSKS